MLYSKNLDIRKSSESDMGVIKKWYDENNHWYIKASSYDKKTKTYHIESVLECVATDIGKLFGVNVVEYWLEELTDKRREVITVCVSKDYKMNEDFIGFITARTALLPAEDEKELHINERYPKLIEYYPDLQADIDKMILFDYLIDNNDRHLRNFEFYILSDESVHLSPLYDNGTSLLWDWDEDELELLKEDDELFEENITYAGTRNKSFSLEHTTALRLVDSLESFDGLNFNITDKQFEDVLNKYKDSLSPLRREMMLALLKQRYQNIKRHYQRIT